METNSSPRLLRLPAVLLLVSVKKSTLYKWMDQGEFPRPRQLGSRAVAWLESEVVAWIEAQEVQA